MTEVGKGRVHLAEDWIDCAEVHRVELLVASVEFKHRVRGVLEKVRLLFWVRICVRYLYGSPFLRLNSLSAPLHLLKVVEYLWLG